MQEIWHWGTGIIIAIQAVHNPALDAFFNIVTSLGSAEFYLILLPLLYWCVDKRQAQLLAYLVLLSAYSNSALKSLFGLPRPFQYDFRILKLDLAPADELGNGFPSGHSQLALVVWGYLATWIRRRWTWVSATILVALIAFSRIYLGVHFPGDVLGGLMLGAGWLGLFVWLGSDLRSWLSTQPVTTQFGMAVAVPLVLLIAYSAGDAAVAMGTLIGVGAGIVIETRIVGFTAGGTIRQRALRFVIGAIGVVILREGLKYVFPGEGEQLYALFRITRYILVGLWVTLGGPWVFHYVGLAEATLAASKKRMAE
jgi:membrane-associated phospholipid phosphatase